jgi:hypothetical protein
MLILVLVRHFINHRYVCRFQGENIVHMNPLLPGASQHFAYDCIEEEEKICGLTG